MKVENRVIFLSIMLLSALLFPIHTARAEGGGTIETFSGGLASISLNFDGQTSSNVTIELNRNTTITNATFMLSSSSSLASPGQVWLDIDEDGVHEWNFTHPSYGSFGEQNVFDNGNQIDNIQTTIGSSANSSNIVLPQGASMTSISLDTMYQADTGGGFYAIGNVLAIESNDVSGDGLEDAAILVNNGSTQEIHVFSMSTTGVSPLTSTTTCSASTLFVDDFDADGYSDVIAVNLSTFTMCTHMYNSTTSQFNAQVNSTLSNDIIQLGVGDMTDDGAADLISIRSNGVVALQEFDDRNSVFNSVAQGHSVTITENNSALPASLTDVYVERFDGSSADVTAIVTDNSFDLHSTEIIYQTSTSALAATSVTFDGLPSNAIVSDIDDDGDLDFVMSGQQGIVYANNTGQTWDISSDSSSMILNGAAIFDHDGDGQQSIFIPNTGTSDNNPQTLEGKLQGYHVDIGSVNSTMFELEPWTNPDIIHSVDFDGDGIVDQIIGAGEANQLGIFIGSWHTAMYDIDKNGDMDVTIEGYAGNGMNGSSQLELIDPSNQMLSILPITSTGWPSTTDGYGIRMSSFNMSYDSSGNGTFILSNLSIRYNADFTVDMNPHIIGNLTNILNQKMVLGSGTFSVPLPFNSTQQGAMNVRDLSIIYTDGAMNLIKPPTPVLQLDFVTSSMVQFSWQNQSIFGDDLLSFSVYRTVAGQTLDESQSYGPPLMSNISLDMNVESNTTYSYYVRSIHQFGVVSNMSDPLNVTIPFPPAPGQIENVTAADTESDQGHSITVSWDQGNESVVEYHLFTNTTPFNTLEGMTSSMSVTNSTTTANLTTDGQGNSLVNGQGYYVAVIGVDAYGNFSSTVSSIGPIYPRNDTVLSPTLTLLVSNTSNHLSYHSVVLNDLFSIDINLSVEGNALSNANISVRIGNDDVTHQTDILTDEFGNANVMLHQFESLTNVTELFGNMSIQALYEGVDHPQTQPVSSVAETLDVFSGSIIEFEIPDTVVVENDQYLLTVVVLSEPALDEDLLAQGQMTWMRKSTDGSLHEQGTISMSSEISVGGPAKTGQIIDISFENLPEFFFVETNTFQITLTGEDPNQNNESNTSELWTPTVILKPTMSCSDLIIPFESDESTASMICSLTNPNPFNISSTFIFDETGAGVTFSLLNPITVLANQTDELTVSVEIDRSKNTFLSGPYTTYGDLTSHWVEDQELSTSVQFDLVWSIAEPQDETQNNEETEATSSLQDILIPAGGGLLGVVLVIFLISKIVTSRGASSRDDDDDGDWYEEAMTMVSSTPEPKEPEKIDTKQIETKTLDSLKEEGKTIGEDAPEERGIDFGFGSKPTSIVDEVSVDEAEDEQSSESSQSGEDDGISVDEDGTEWYEDELGVWWYREEGWEDWAEWKE